MTSWLCSRRSWAIILVVARLDFGKGCEFVLGWEFGCYSVWETPIVIAISDLSSGCSSWCAQAM